jgi:uridine kinase
MGNQETKCVIAVAGGTGSGKTTLIEALADVIGLEIVATLSHDDYYKDQSHREVNQRHNVNFDHPDSLDTELLIEHIKKLRSGLPVAVPAYNFETHTRCKGSLLKPKPLVIVDGILLLYDHNLRELFDVKVFIEADADIRFIRRQQRDVLHRGRTHDSVASQWVDSVKPMHDRYVETSRQHADIIVSGNEDQKIAVDQLLSHLRGTFSIT